MRETTVSMQKCRANLRIVATTESRDPLRKKIHGASQRFAFTTVTFRDKEKLVYLSSLYFADLSLPCDKTHDGI